MNAGHQYVGGTHDSGIVSSTDDLLGMSVVCGEELVECVKCVCVLLRVVWG